MADKGTRTPWEAELADRLASARDRTGRSAEDVAQRARQYGILLHGTDIVQIESGVRPIGLNDALVLSKVLDVELPEVTARVDAQLITSSYAQRHQALSRRWHEIVAEIKLCKREVDDLFTQLTSLVGAYQAEMSAAQASCDPDVEADLEALAQQVEVAANSFGDVDRRLDGVLSLPSAPAAEPGTQG